MKRMKPLTKEQAGKAVAHWRRRLTDAEAKKAAELVKSALAEAGIEAEVLPPMALKAGEASVFGEAKKYSEAKCRLWGGSGVLGWDSPYMIAKLKNPPKKTRSETRSTVAGLTEVRVQFELCAGFTGYGKNQVEGKDPRRDFEKRRLTRADVEKIDADPRWECETWDAMIWTNGRERPYRRRSWGRWQTPRPFVYAPTLEGLGPELAEQFDDMARDLGLGKYRRKA